MDNEKVVLMATDPELFVIGEVVLLDLGILKQPIQILHVLGTMLIDETPIRDRSRASRLWNEHYHRKHMFGRSIWGQKKNHNT